MMLVEGLYPANNRFRILTRRLGYRTSWPWVYGLFKDFRSAHILSDSEDSKVFGSGEVDVSCVSAVNVSYRMVLCSTVSAVNM